MSEISKNDSQLATLKRAYIKLEELQGKVRTLENAQREPIAVIGMGCRFPGNAMDAGSFWTILENGIDTVSEVPRDRWDIDAYYDPDPDAPAKMATRWGAFIDHIDRFDASFFGISPKEATSMDPQQRILLEVCWEALENAGISPESMAGSATGVFIGIIGEEYGQQQTANGGIAHINTYFGSGSSRSVASGRIAYVLGLEGPAISIDTSCSSSMVAAHLACLSLRAKECNTALVGGVNAILSPETTIALTKHRLMAADGHCKTFDQSADGYVRGEGCGVAVLKRLSDAVRQGDRILAVIRGTAMNQDGASSGLTAPHGPSQQRVIQAALKNAGVSPSDIGYVETHGTGTALGDPIEVQALSAVLGKNRKPGEPIYIGAVKTNLGHLEAAAGMASLFKTILVLQNRHIPPHLNMRTPNPMIPWDKLPVKVPLEGVDWAPERPLIAGVSAFGFSGTNVHMILSAPPEEKQKEGTPRPWHMLCLSAKSPDALQEQAQNFRDHLSENPEADSGSLCFSANRGRSHFSYRLTILGKSPRDFFEKLDAYANGSVHQDVAMEKAENPEKAKIVFMFTGQGSQYAGMGRELYQTQPVFRQTVDYCDSVLQDQIGCSIRSILFPQSPGDEADRINQTRFTQPALFTMEYALYELWRSWGIEPSAVMGHSVGEYVAACSAGILSLDDALKLISLRAGLMQSLPAGGAMAVVFSNLKFVESVLDELKITVDVAADNGPENVVISGASESVNRALVAFSERGVKSTPLNVSHAFHSMLMEPILDKFKAVARTISYRPPSIHLISNVTGKAMSVQNSIDAEYWCRHIRRPVQFRESMEELYRLGYRHFLEIGPNPVLINMGKRCVPEADARWLASIRRGREEWREMTATSAELYRMGSVMNWEGFYAGTPVSRVPLPTYPFKRRRFWTDRRHDQVDLPAAETVHPLLGRHIRSASKTTLFESVIKSEDFDFIASHRIHGITIMPAAAFIEMAVSAVRLLMGIDAISFNNAVIHEPLYFAEDSAQVIQTVVSPADDDGHAVEILSLDSDPSELPETGHRFTQKWRCHFSGTAHAEAHHPPAMPEGLLSPDMVKSQCPERIESDFHYHHLNGRGFHFGEALQTVSAVYKGKDTALGKVQPADQGLSGSEGLFIPPAMLDGCLQFFWTLLPEEDDSGSYLPMGFEKFTVFSNSFNDLQSHITLRGEGPRSKDTLVGDVFIYDAAGSPVAMMEALAFRKISRKALMKNRSASIADWFYAVQWQPSDKAPADETGSGAHEEETVGALNIPVAGMAADLKTDLFALTETYALESSREIVKKIDKLSTLYIIKAFHVLGWRPETGTRTTPEILIREMGILPKYKSQTARLLQILTEDGYLKKVETEWEVVNVPNVQPFDPDTLLGKIRENTETAQSAQLELVVRCGQSFADALSGKVNPLSLLFPEGSLALAARLYSESPEAKVYNSLVREAVKRALSVCPTDRKVRILELGAGTGGATSFVLPGLPPDRVSYTFTDLSPVFLKQAGERFKSYPFVDYQLCNIEMSPESQGFQSEYFDIVIAMNMLHATSDMKLTMKNVRDFLIPGGALILLEGTAPERWIDITFGLTDGWWAFKDRQLRPDYPLLDRSKWKTLLDETGFETPVAVPEHSDLSEEAVIIAVKSNGAERTVLKSENWLIFTDSEGVGDSLANQMRTDGATCVTVRPGKEFGRSSTADWMVEADNPHAYDQLFEDLKENGHTRFKGVIYLWAANSRQPDKSPSGSLMDIEMSGSGGLLFLIQSMGKALEWADPPHLYVVTCGAQPAGNKGIPAFCHAAVWGLCKVVTLEHPELNCRCFDLDPLDGTSEKVRQVMTELKAGDSELLVAYREGHRQVARLEKADLKNTSDGKAMPLGHPDPVVLEKPATGVLEDLKLAPMSRRSPEEGEVEIAVHAAGLGFRDIMNALAMRADPDPLGSECAGRVVAVGEGVDHLFPGDAVMAVSKGGMSSYVTTDARFVVPLPDGLGMVEGAALPTAFLTAHYALNHVGKIKSGDWVLIHAAAGGVGMAAVQLALNAGALVVGTAGNEKKRSYLESIGVEHVYDSRSLDFADQIFALTKGRGVDLVLNSLSGEFISKSLSALAPGGCFLEIGKRDILTPEAAKRIRPDVAYHVLDLAAFSDTKPDLIRTLLGEIGALSERGAIRGLPLTLFPLSNAAEAFRFMAQARHIGKIIIVNEAANPKGFRGKIRSEATYVITGGLSGIGLLTAEDLVSKGARHIALIGRSHPGEAARSAINEMAQSGAVVKTLLADVGCFSEIEKSIKQIREEMPEIRGIIHSAGTLADGVLMKQDWDRFKRVMAPKIDGAWHLHNLSKNLELDFFVLYSSTAGLFGSPGQGNHAAANAFMDGLAHYRRSVGLPALSINWGTWSRLGAAAARQADQRLIQQGILPITPEDGLMALEKAMSQPAPQIAAVPLNWRQFLSRYAGGTRPSWLSKIMAPSGNTAQMVTRSAETGQPHSDIPEKLKSTPVAKRFKMLQEYVVGQTLKALGLDMDADIDPGKPLNEQGVDSLMAVELRNMLGKGLNLKRGLPATLIFDYPTVVDLVHFLAGEASISLTGEPLKTAEKKAAIGSTDDLLDQIEGLSDDEVGKRLQNEN